jgi:anti-sigma factor RsiW
MPDCASLDRLITPYIDGELDAAERAAVEAHVRRCPPCYSRVAAERAVHDLIHTKQHSLHGECASAALKARCAQACGVGRASRRTVRLLPLATAAALILVVGGATLYVATAKSTRVLAAELTADHLKCFALNAVLRTHDSAEVVRGAMVSGFEWPLAFSDDDLARSGLELVGSRPCLYGEGQTAHVMFRYHGRPVSLFMLPRVQRPETLVDVLGHECAIWSVADRTFVLIAREERGEVQRMAAAMQGSLK